MKTVFLDRDGIVNVDRPDFAKTWDEFVFVDGVAAALRRLREAGFRLVLVTNQSCVGRGIVTLADVEEIHARMQFELEGEGAEFDAIYVCPHAPEEGCDCRKPLPGNILRAIDEQNSDPAKSVMAGDSERDVVAGHAAGIKTILVSPAGPDVCEGWEVKPDRVIENVFLLPETIAELLS